MDTPGRQRDKKTVRKTDRQTDSEAVRQVTEPGACQDITGYVQQQQHQQNPAATRDEIGNKTALD